LSDPATANILTSRQTDVKTPILLNALGLCAFLAAAQSPGHPSVGISTLPAAEQAAINTAIKRWDRQFKWKAINNLEKPIADASVETVHLGPANEKDLVVTDQSACSPTGNCSILVLRSAHGRYRVVLDGIGQSFNIRPSRTNGFRNIELAMHGSATESTVKIYKFNGSRYLRSGCQDVSFETLDKEGNRQELEKPLVTPCR
jgi:hypothetical protein